MTSSREHTALKATARLERSMASPEITPLGNKIAHINVCDVREAIVENYAMKSQNAALTSQVEALREALEAAREFIASEYSDAEAQALQGEFLSREARPVFSKICGALIDAALSKAGSK